MKKWICLFCILVVHVSSLYGQSLYWIVFRDKATTPFDIRSILSAEAIANRNAHGRIPGNTALHGHCTQGKLPLDQCCFRFR